MTVKIKLKMASIKENITKYREELPGEVTLVAVSKTKPNEDLLAAYEAGQRVFGERFCWAGRFGRLMVLYEKCVPGTELRDFFLF